MTMFLHRDSIPLRLGCSSSFPSPLTLVERSSTRCLRIPHENLYVDRVDWNLSEKHSLFFRDFHAINNQPSAFNGTNAVASNSLHDFAALNEIIGDTYTFTNNMINSFRLGADRLDYRRGAPSGFPGPKTVGINNNAPTDTNCCSP